MLNYRPKMFSEAPDKNTSNDFLIILISFSAVFLIIFGMELFINGLLYSSGIMRDENPENDNVVYISSLLFRGLTVVIIILYCRFLEGRPVCSMGLRKKNFFIHYISGLIVGAVMVSASILILKYLGAVSITPCENVNYMLIVLFFIGFIVQGMSEEFIFRGYLFTSVGSSGHHTMLAVITSSIAFGIAHNETESFNIFYFICTILFGVFSALYMTLFDNIWGVCAIHSMWNFATVNVYGSSQNYVRESIMRTTSIANNGYLTGREYKIADNIFSSIIIGIGIIIVSILLFIKYKISKPEPTEHHV